MSFFTGAQGTSITGNNVTMTAITYAGPQASDRGFDILRQSATPSAIYGSNTSDSEKELGCLHGTRLDVQGHIVKWLNDPEGTVGMWMYGPAGIGKTAIAQTIAKLCEEQNQLSSAFFFFRSDEGRNSAKHLVPTLAFEMLQQMRHTHNIICTRIAENPLILSAPLERQIKAIILPAISAPYSSSQSMQQGPMLFIIDGLDECADPRSQKSIIRLFISLLAGTTTAVRHKILIVSRPESQIVSAFYADDIAPHVHHLCLDEWKSINDIELFLRAELEEVKRTHPLKSYLDADWPSSNSFYKLLNKSFESFAYATSAIRYISSHDRNPATSLDHLLDLNPDGTFEAHAELDSLYHHILNSLHEKTRYVVLKTLCLHTWSLEPANILTVFGSILGEEASTIELALIKVSSVIRLRKDRLFSYYHTSFRDFLLDKTRSGPLCLYSPRVATGVAEALLSRLSWAHPVTFGSPEYKLLDAIDNMFRDMHTIAVDLQVHILNTFLATCLPTISLAAPNHFRPGFFASINRGCLSEEDHPVSSLTLLYRQAFDYMATWLRSQVGADTRSSETILNICFQPALRPPLCSTIAPDLSVTIFNLVRKSTDPWWTIRRLLSQDESWKICIVLVKIYLAMPQDARTEDMMQDYRLANRHADTPSILPMTTILVHILQSEPVRPEVCRVLEETVASAMSLSGDQISPQSLLCFHLSQHVLKSTKGPDVQETITEYCHIAESMDFYIRKTHSDLELPYISDGVRRLYCDVFPGVTAPVPRYKKRGTEIRQLTYFGGSH